MKNEGHNDTNCKCHVWNGLERIKNGAGRVGNWRMNRDYPNGSIVKIGQNTAKSPGDLRRHAVTQTPMKDHPLMLV